MPDIKEEKKTRINLPVQSAIEDDTSDYETELVLTKKPAVPKPIRAVIPLKGDKPVEVVRKCVLLVSVVVAAVCVALILSDSGAEKKQSLIDENRAFERLQIERSGVIPLEAEKIAEIREEAPGILDQYLPFYADNPDIIGWVKIPGTVLDYPVMQTADNEYYLFRDFNKNDSKFGSIFADWHVPFTPTTRPNNTVLYGHNIAGGTYFASVTNYFPYKYGTLDYLKDHPTVQFDTIYEPGTYKIFAGIFINTLESHGYVYPYYQKRVFENRDDFYNFAVNIMDRTVFFTDADLEYGDEILTLSTCYYPFGGDADTRFAIFARRVRPGEDPGVDVTQVVKNPNALYFDLYYRTMGGRWQGRDWDLSRVKGAEEYLSQNEPNAVLINN